jgi:hypothetical protein
MNKAPYSLAEAQKICCEYQHLKSQQFDQEMTTGIDAVVIAPFAEEDKKRFFLCYLLFDDAELALKDEYNGLLFDVVVIAGAKGGYELLQQDLYTWLAKNKCLPVFNNHIAELIPLPVAIY